MTTGAASLTHGWRSLTSHCVTTATVDAEETLGRVFLAPEYVKCPLMARPDDCEALRRGDCTHNPFAARQLQQGEVYDTLCVCG